jgi:hypothetical protein
MYARLRSAALVLIASVVPSLVGAQHTNAPSAPQSGPRLEALVTGIQAPSAQASVAFSQQRQNVGKPVALMVVGGAAVVLGALIGGDVGLLFMIGGAVALLIGLYKYLQ